MLGFSAKIETVIGEGAEIKGNLSVSGAIHVNGHIKGNVQSDGIITLGEKGDVEGDLSAPVVVIGGKLRGNVEGGARVELLKSARVGGDIRAPKLLVAEGAHFEGNCEMIQPDKATVDFKSIKNK